MGYNFYQNAEKNEKEIVSRMVGLNQHL